MRIYYLAGVILSVTSILSACGEGTPTECTITTPQDLRKGVSKTAKFASGTDCEAMRKLAEEGKPLPTIADGITSNASPKAVATTNAPNFNTPFVAGQKTLGLIAITDKQARVQELEKKIGVDSKQSRDPFTSSIINPVPNLETLLAKPKELPNLRSAIVVRTPPTIIKILLPPPRPPRPPRPPLPPDIKAAEGTKVTGTVEIAGMMFAIIQAFDEPTSRYVRAGQMISNGKVLVKRIDTNSEPPIVVLQQNGVEVLRPVGAPAIGAVDTTQPPQTAAPAPTPQQTPAPPILTPAQ